MVEEPTETDMVPCMDDESQKKVSKVFKKLGLDATLHDAETRYENLPNGMDTVHTRECRFVIGESVIHEVHVRYDDLREVSPYESTDYSQTLTLDFNITDPNVIIDTPPADLKIIFDKSFFGIVKKNIRWAGMPAEFVASVVNDPDLDAETYDRKVSIEILRTDDGWTLKRVASFGKRSTNDNIGVHLAATLHWDETLRIAKYLRVLSSEKS